VIEGVSTRGDNLTLVVSGNDLDGSR